jgi:hypothetical protein
MTNESTTEHIINWSVQLFCNQPKGLQVDTVSSLVEGKHTFVLVGTAFGKTHISEMFFVLFEKRVVLLVLNQLDSLGDDQVYPFDQG